MTNGTINMLLQTPRPSQNEENDGMQCNAMQCNARRWDAIQSNVFQCIPTQWKQIGTTSASTTMTILILHRRGWDGMGRDGMRSETDNSKHAVLVRLCVYGTSNQAGWTKQKSNHPPTLSYRRCSPKCHHQPHHRSQNNCARSAQTQTKTKTIPSSTNSSPVPSHGVSVARWRDKIRTAGLVYRTWHSA